MFVAGCDGVGCVGPSEPAAVFQTGSGSALVHGPEPGPGLGGGLWGGGEGGLKDRRRRGEVGLDEDVDSGGVIEEMRKELR